MEERCRGCGFVYDEGRGTRAGPAIVDRAGALAAVLRERDGGDLRARPQPARWSPLEYACHVRDVLLVQRERVLTARRSDTPTVTPMGRDERVDHDGYREQRPGDVARQVEDAAALLANVLARLAPRDWDRTLVYNHPEPATRSLRWVAVHTLHELQHHLADVRQQLG